MDFTCLYEFLHLLFVARVSLKDAGQVTFFSYS